MDEALIRLDTHEAPQPCDAALMQLKEPQAYRTSILYELAGARASDVFLFTSSGAEAVNQVLLSVFLEVSRKEGKCHFVTSLVEDAPTLQMMKRLEELGCYVKIAPVNQRGEIDVKKLAELINPRTALISVCMAQGLTGVIQPVEEVAELARSKGIRLHLDASYAMGKYPLSFEELGADYLTFSGDQIHSVPGSGGLFARAEAPLVPLILGGASLRGGSFDSFSSAALCAAGQQSLLYLDRMALEVARLRDRFESELMRRIPGSMVLFADALRLPNVASVYFPRVHQEALLYMLERRKVLASIGGKASAYLHRLVGATGFDETASRSTLSFSLSRMTTEAQMMRAVEAIALSAASLQAISQGVFDVVA